MPLDPQIKATLDLQMGAPKPYQQSVADARAGVFNRPRIAGPEMASEEDRRIPGRGGEIPIRVYRPRQPSGAVLVYFHGGGWVTGTLDTHNGQCRCLAGGSGAVVVAVDYREAPEHRFPAAAEDAYAAVKWVSQHASELGVDARRLGVTGDSAGGNLAAVACLMARDRGGPPIFVQLLAYPVTDYSFDRPSYQENGSGYGLEAETMRWFWEHYLGADQDGRQPYASPMRAESLAGLPRAIVVTCEYDVLRDEGNAYAERLLNAGVPVDLRCVPGVNHGFLGAPLELTVREYERICALLRAAVE